MQRGVLVSNRNLIISLFVDDDDHSYVEIQSTRHGPDLSLPDEVIVAIDGEVLPLAEVSPDLVRVHLAPSVAEGVEFSLMIRVCEFFEGWEIAL